jgi:hypothetical protein
VGQIDTSRPRGGSATALDLNPTASIRRTTLIRETDAVIKRIDGMSGENIAVGSTFSGVSRILDVKHHQRLEGWRVNVRKLAMLARLQKGWDYPDSEPLDRDAEANYLEWVSHVPAHRMADAEPMLTDDGHIRLEWRRNGCKRIAEIGANSLYLASLTPDRQNDDAEEFDRYDERALTRFFASGRLR